MKNNISPNELRRAVEAKHGCRAGLSKSEFVKVHAAGSTIWEGLVHVFDLAGHPEAHQAYAWSSPVAGSNRSRQFSVLHLPPVTSPIDAVRVALGLENEMR